MSHARGFAAAGFAVVAIDAPNHGDRPKDEEFGRIAAGMRAGLAAGESPGALVAGMHSYLARQAVADWRAVLTAVQCLDQVGVGPAGYCGMSMGCGLGIPLTAAEPRIRAAVLGWCSSRSAGTEASRCSLPSTVPIRSRSASDVPLSGRPARGAVRPRLANQAVRTEHKEVQVHGAERGYPLRGGLVIAAVAELSGGWSSSRRVRAWWPRAAVVDESASA